MSCGHAVFHPEEEVEALLQTVELWCHANRWISRHAGKEAWVHVAFGGGEVNVQMFRLPTPTLQLAKGP
jgi:hypothetical protein